MQGQTYERMHIKYRRNPPKEEGTTQMSLKMLHDEAQQDTDLPGVLLQSKYFWFCLSETEGASRERKDELKIPELILHNIKCSRHLVYF